MYYQSILEGIHVKISHLLEDKVTTGETLLFIHNLSHVCCSLQAMKSLVDFIQGVHDWYGGGITHS